MRAHMVVKCIRGRERTSAETTFERSIVGMRDHVRGELGGLSERTRTVTALVGLLWRFVKVRIFVGNLEWAELTAVIKVDLAWNFVTLARTNVILAWTNVILAAWTSTILAGNRNGRCGGWGQSWRKREVNIVDVSGWRRTAARCDVLLMLLVAW